MAVDVCVRNAVLTAIGSGYLAFLWLPFTPEKIITVMIAVFLMKKLVPKDIGSVRELLRLMTGYRAKNSDYNNKNIAHLTSHGGKNNMKKIITAVSILASACIMMTSCNINDLFEINLQDIVPPEESISEDTNKSKSETGLLTHIMNFFDTPPNLTPGSEEKPYTRIDEMQKNNEFDEILCKGDDYIVVNKTYDNYDGYYILVGVLNTEGEWMRELSKSNIFAKAYSDTSKKTEFVNGGAIGLKSDNFYYLGEGIFIASLGVEINYPGYRVNVGSYSSLGSSGLECYFFDVVNDIQTSFKATNISPYYDGFMLMYNSERYNSHFYRVNKYGEAEELPCIYSSVWSIGYPAYSDGVFFAEGKFYDIDGNVVLDISNYRLYGLEYNDRREPPYFVDGKCTIKFRNSGGTLYKAVIDKKGNYIEQPKKFE